MPAIQVLCSRSKMPIHTRRVPPLPNPLPQGGREFRLGISCLEPSPLTGEGRGGGGSANAWESGVWIAKLAPLAALILLLVGLAAPSAGATEIQEVRSPGGITAWLVHEPAVPVVAMSFSFKGGGALDPEGKEGLANLVSGLLDEGAGELDSLAFQTRLEDLAIQLGFDAGRDAFSGDLRTLSRHKEEAFRLLGLALNEPRFDAEPMERIRRQIVARLTRELEDPDSIAARTWFATAFAGHPYWHRTGGSTESVKAVTAADLRAFVERRLARDSLVIGVVGDLTAEELGPLLDGTFGSLPARGDSPAVPETRPKTDGGLKLVRKPIPQSVVIFGMPGIKRDDPDWYTAHLMNYVLGGGGLTSRLSEEVREKRGLAYSVYSHLMPFDHAGVYFGGVGTQNARVAETLEIIKRELARLAADGISEVELADAKTYINGSFPLRLTSSGRIANLLVAIQLHDLGIDYIERRPELYDRVTQEDVKRVAKRLLRPENMLIVVVGDPEGLDVDG